MGGGEEELTRKTGGRRKKGVDAGFISCIAGNSQGRRAGVRSPITNVFLARMQEGRSNTAEPKGEDVLFNPTARGNSSSTKEPGEVMNLPCCWVKTRRFGLPGTIGTAKTHELSHLGSRQEGGGTENQEITK